MHFSGHFPELRKFVVSPALHEDVGEHISWLLVAAGAGLGVGRLFVRRDGQQRKASNHDKVRTQRVVHHVASICHNVVSDFQNKERHCRRQPDTLKRPSRHVHFQLSFSISRIVVCPN
jgi:hypothetical protein